MTRKKTKEEPTPEQDSRDGLTVTSDKYPGKTKLRIDAELAQDPLVRNAQTARIFDHYLMGKVDLTESVRALGDKVAKIQGGDLSDGEAMLMAQASALDAIFTQMACRASLNMVDYLDAADTYMRLALKAQSQCRTTLEALAEIKNPRAVAFVKQANIAHGPQQVNNAAASARTGEKIIPSNEVSEAGYELLPDTRASAIESRVDTPMEAVGAINWAKD